MREGSPVPRNGSQLTGDGYGPRMRLSRILALILAIAVGFAALAAPAEAKRRPRPKARPSPSATQVPAQAPGQVPSSVPGCVNLTTDMGRPVCEIARDLGVPAEVFREAFTHVTPAAKGAEPSDAQREANRQALLSRLSQYGVTPALLDQVSDRYRL